MSLPESFLEEIRNRVSLAEVIGRHVRLVRKGREHQGLCPFHNEKTPSFTVNESKGFYHCFGCGAHGSLFDFVMQAEKVGFREAVERLAAMAGLTVPAATPEAQAKERQRRSLLEALEAAAAFYQQRLKLPDGKEAAAYLHARGVAPAFVERFRLGFASPGRSTLSSALMRDGFGEDVLAAAGLLVVPDASEGGRAPYDRFRGRVMFPILDRRGRVISFGGRILGSGEPKYLNGPETALYHKGRALYGLSQAVDACHIARSVVVVEGYMDVIGLSQAGFAHVVAPLGTALTGDQLALLWTLAPEPVLLFDPDAAGARAAIRAAERALPLLKPGLGLRFAVLRVDTRDDPDSVAARYPPQALHRTLVEAAPLSEYLFRVETGGRQRLGAEDRAGLSQRLRQRALAIADREVRRQFLSVWRDRLWQATRSPGGQWARSQQGGRRAVGGAQASPGTVAAEPFVTARMDMPDPQTPTASALLALMVRHPRACASMEETLGSLNFRDNELDHLRQALVEILSSENCPEPDSLQQALRIRGLGAELDRVLAVPGPEVENDNEIILRCTEELNRFHRLSLQRELTDILMTTDISAEAWERERALIRAAVDDEGQS